MDHLDILRLYTINDEIGIVYCFRYGGGSLYSRVECFDFGEGGVGYVVGGDGGWCLEVLGNEGGEHGLTHFACADEGDFGEDVFVFGGGGIIGGSGGGGGEVVGAMMTTVW